MRKLPTVTAEQVYRLLQNKLRASPDHYDREAFVYHYTLVNDAPDAHRLRCEDGESRTFHCNSSLEMWVSGEGTEVVNSILRQIYKELSSTQKIGEFTVTAK